MNVNFSHVVRPHIRKQNRTVFALGLCRLLNNRWRHWVLHGSLSGGRKRGVQILESGSCDSCTRLASEHRIGNRKFSPTCFV